MQTIGKGRALCKIFRPYEVWKDGVYVKDERKKLKPGDGQGLIANVKKKMPQDRRPFFVRFAWSPLWLGGYGEDVDTGDQYVRLRALRNGRLYDEWIERGIILHDFKLGELANRGFPVASVYSKAIVTYLANLDARNAPARMESITSRNGYVPLPDKKFGWVVGPRWIGPEGSKAYLAATAQQHPLMQSIRDEGSIEEWLKLVEPFFKRVGDEAALARWMIAASFAPVLLRPLNQRSFVVHHWGGSGAGKSALSRLSAAAWGDPNVFCMLLNRTLKSFPETFRYFSDMPAIFDELQSADFRFEARSIGQMIHTVVGEQSRIGANRTVGSRKGVTWKTILRLNGEEPILGSSVIDLGGFAGRVLQIKLDVMETAQAKKLNEALNQQNFGHAGPYFLKQLEPLINNNLGALTARYKKFERSALGLVSETAQRRAPMLAVVALAEMLFRVWMLGQSYGQASVESLEDLVAVGERIDTGPPPNVAASAIEIFQSYRASNPDSFAIKNDTTTHRGRNLAGYTMEDAEGRHLVCWDQKHAIQLLTKNHLNADRAISEMKEEGTLIVGKQRDATQIRLGSSRKQAKRFWAYVFDLGDSDRRKREK